MRYNSPCKDCSKRHQLCHSKCEAYLEYKAKNEEQSSEIAKIKKHEFDINELMISSRRKRRRYNNYKF